MTRHFPAALPGCPRFIPVFAVASRRPVAATLPVLACLLAVPAAAQEVTPLAPITVTANRGETETARSGATVEIVSQDDLEQAGDIRLVDYLATLPGLSLTTAGGIGNATTLRIRGAGGAYFGVYVDGIDVNDPSAAQISFNFGSLTTADISRVEVLKGAQSALYGSEAIAGVISISTNRATEPGLSQSYALEYGSYNTRQLSLNQSYMGTRGTYALSLSHIETDGYSSADENDGNTEADGHEGTRLNLTGEYDLTDALTFGGAAFWQKTETEYDEYTSGPVDGSPDEVTKATSYGLRGFLRFDGAILEQEISAQYYRIDRESRGTNTWGASYYPNLGIRKSLAYAASMDLSNAFTLAFGADATRETYDGDTFVAETDQLGAYAEGQWAPSETFDLVASVRHDDHSVFGGETTGRLAAAWRPRSDVTLRASAGTGFRTPSLYELYDPWYGNSDLQPETSKSYDLGVEKRLGESGFVKATLFRMEITNLIDWVGSGYTQVEGESTMQGVELSGGWRLSETLRLDTSYTYTDAEDASGARLDRVPRNELALRLAADLTPQLRGGLVVRRVSDHLDSGTPLPDYTLVDVTLGYDIAKDREIYLRIVNLLDEEYQTVRGYGQSDRAFYVGIRGNF
ncbi:TonB-dependent receptor plug domain-containing protein [Pseudooceanicola algae]|uniref:Vitamin B12 transporter BtuB n=1 Tax=Pseudooceanicola algae TaxID=1537215 RepID=A0A418SIY5_9RHOB|nr:TonB-dependent receptor [Pseudooceanicola algae]QPM91207.1 Vitamin B12 transporter BtuB [Pseudooceanicola algae]